jgi:hypothetical protein
MGRDKGPVNRFVLRSAGIFWGLAFLSLLAYRGGYDGAVDLGRVFIIPAVIMTLIAIMLWAG